MVKAAGTAPAAALGMFLQKIAAALRRKKPAAPPARNTPAAAPPTRGGGVGGPLHGLGDALANAFSSAGNFFGSLTPAQFHKLAAALEDRRHREINRLLSLLKNNPDEGLRYALPLTGDAPRGLAPPSADLSARDVNFTLSGLGGGGRPADAWNLSYDLQRQLRDQYRALATRELQLGRHRRAAYVFAELLGDFAAAASALRQGRHFREAATLYLDRLHDQKAAADCLRDGGLPLEAIPLYELLGHHETVAELYTQVGQLEAAATAYRRVVADLRARGDALKAAKILEEKLAAPRDALAALDAAWPDTPQGPACLAESFRLLARLDDSDEIHARLRRCRDARLPVGLVPPLANVLTEVAATSPAAPTRRLAQDAAKVVIGRHLLTAAGPEARALVDCLPALSPADRLLPRDAYRYAQSLQPRPGLPIPRVPMATPPRRVPLAPRVVAEFILPRPACTAFVSAGPVFYAIEPGLVHQFDWRGGGRSAPLSDQHPGCHLLVHCDEPYQLWTVRPVFGAVRTPFGFPGMGTLPVAAVHMPFDPPNVLAAACDDKRQGWVLHAEAAPDMGNALSVFEPATGHVVATYAAPPPLPEQADQPIRVPVPLAVRYNHVYLASGDSLAIMPYGRAWQPFHIPSPATHMAVTHPLARARVVVGLESGGMVFSDGLDHAPVGEGLLSPRFAFTRGGALVAVTKSEIRIYRFDGKRPDYRGSVDGMGFDAADPAAAVLPTDRMDEIALIAPGGRVRVLSIDGF
jgi:tetratricopeptide (TPR) repeat protein